MGGARSESQAPCPPGYSFRLRETVPSPRCKETRSLEDLLGQHPHPTGAAVETLRPRISPLGKEGHSDHSLCVRECGSWSILKMGAPGLAPARDLPSQSS